MKCLCGCGADVKKSYVRGHQFRKPVISAVEMNPLMARLNIIPDMSATPQTTQQIIANGPPRHPLPFDHRLFRLAVERPGTLVTNPWRDFPCSECKEQTWTREEKAEYGTVICEDCMWRLSESMGEGQVKQGRTMARMPHNPFE